MATIKLTPSELSDYITEIVSSEAAAGGYRISPGAVVSLATIPPPFDSDASIEIDDALLRPALREVLSNARAFKSGYIEPSDVPQLLSRSQCHYLWFC